MLGEYCDSGPISLNSLCCLDEQSNATLPCPHAVCSDHQWPDLEDKCFHRDLDLLGNNLGVPLAVASREECRDYCQGEEECKSFVVTLNLECWMKSIDLGPGVFVRSGITSGSKYCGMESPRG